MKKVLITFCSVLFTGLLFSQSLIPYNWAENRQQYQLSEEQNNLPFVYLKYHKQFIYDYDGADMDLVIYETEHQIIKVNNDNALARNNRIYIPMYNTIELLQLNARTITKDGRIITLNQDEIKEIEDEESGSGYKIFAIEGAEVGSEIEYFYTKKTYTSYFGREFFQFAEPIANASFLLISPENLEFAFKSYNGLDSIKTDNAEGTNIYTLNADQIPGLKKEEFSAYNNSRYRLEFKLAFNKVNNRPLFRWTDAAQYLHRQMFVIDKEEQKQIDKLISAVNIKNLDEKGKVSAIEDYIKTNIYFDENANGDANSIIYMLQNKIGGKLGLAKLLLNCMRAMDIEAQLVLTNDRNEIAFDGDFETYNYLQEYLIYLPESNNFVAPYSPEYRYGMVPYEFTENKGLFISEAVADGITLPKAEVKSIPALTAKDNLDKMEVTVDFNENLTANKVKLVRSFNGYQAAFIKAVYPLIEEERRQELLKSLVKFLANDADIKTLKLLNDQFSYEKWAEALVVESEFESPSYIEQAGDIILLKAGEMIGPQTELYQENERKTTVVNEFNRAYERTITINLPEGYRIENLDDLLFDKKVMADNKEIYYFKSSYTINGNLLKIQVDEAYEQIYFPKERFEEFREVINAAADWNKIVLVLSKG